MAANRKSPGRRTATARTVLQDIYLTSRGRDLHPEALQRLIPIKCVLLAAGANAIDARLPNSHRRHGRSSNHIAITLAYVPERLRASPQEIIAALYMFYQCFIGTKSNPE